MDKSSALTVQARHTYNSMGPSLLQSQHVCSSTCASLQAESTCLGYTRRFPLSSMYALRFMTILTGCVTIVQDAAGKEKVLTPSGSPQRP